MAFDNPPGLLALLQIALDRGDWVEVSRLARDLLSGPIRTDDASVRQARALALEALDKAGERPAYAAEWQQKCCRDTTKTENFLRAGEAAINPQEKQAAYREAFRLEPDNVIAAEALLEKSPEGSEGELEWFEALLAARPLEALNRFYFQRRFMYGKRQAYPRLATKLAAAPFPAVATDQRFPLENTLHTIIGQMRFAGHHGPADLVLQKAYAVLGPQARVVRNQMLVQATERGVAAFRNPAVAYLLLPEPAETPPADRVAWSERQPLFDEPALRLAHEAGLQATLVERVALVAPRYPEARGLEFFLRVLDRDLAVLPALLAHARAEQPRTYAGWALPTIEELATWREGAEAAQQLLATYQEQLLSRLGGGITGQRGLAELAARIGSTPMVANAARTMMAEAQKPDGSGLRALVAGLDAAIASRDVALLKSGTELLIQRVQACQDPKDVVIPAAKRMAGQLIGARIFEAADAVLLALERNPAAVKEEENASVRWTIIALQAERGLHRGEIVNLQPVAWVDARLSTSERAVMVWDLSVSRWEHHLAEVLFGEPPDAVKKATDWEVLLLYGETKEYLHEFARVSRTGRRGVWRGAWPGRSGFLSVVLTGGGALHRGPALSFVAGENLLRLLPAEELRASAQPVTIRQGSPDWRGSHLAFARTGQGNTTTVIGEPVKVIPGREYEISGWLHHESDLTLQFDVQFLDAFQNVLGATRHGIDLNPWRWWHRSKFRVADPPLSQVAFVAARQTVSDFTMPPGTAYLLPVVTTAGDACEAAGLSIVLVPQ